MENYNIKINLTKLKNVKVAKLEEKGIKRQYLMIPIEDNELFIGKKGIYLELTAYLLNNPKYNETHFIKKNIQKDKYNLMTEEEKKQIPIIGSLSSIINKIEDLNIGVINEKNINIDDDLPF